MSNTAPQRKFKGNDILRDLIPLNALTKDRFREISGSLSIEDISAGSYLFGEGDLDEPVAKEDKITELQAVPSTLKTEFTA